MCRRRRWKPKQEFDEEVACKNCGYGEEAYARLNFKGEPAMWSYYCKECVIDIIKTKFDDIKVFEVLS